MNHLQKYLLCFLMIGILLPLSHTYGDNYSDTASGLKRILRIDRSIRTGSGKIILQKQNRAIIINNYKNSLENLIHTWNYIPTTDKTLNYTLTLQKYKLSCEIAAMKAVYGALGYPRSEDDIIKTLPHHNKSYDESTQTWGDPDIEFVGLIDGSQNQKTGYGIYEKAIEKNFIQEIGKYIPKLKTEAWNDFSRPKDYTDKLHLTHLLGALDNGGHVIIWGDWCTNPGYEDGILQRDKTLIMQHFPIPGKNTCKSWNVKRDFSWKTKEGKDVIAFNGDHVFLLLGYIGKKENPSHIIVWDTDTGRHIYNTEEWMRKWGNLNHRSLTLWK